MKYNEKQQKEIANYAIAHDNDYKMTGKKYDISYQQVSAWVRKYNKSSNEQKKTTKIKDSTKKSTASTLDILSRRDPVLEAQLEDVKRRLGLK
ncbi:helix-turn-helix domain containing protein [Companilactobacillus allii]|uniref:Transposase n=1 Tax=Companilactobacillus allii TaxID=1847728 RepID=A0A1P8Q526_9LACO|nr:helix-turn-helix domain-containing protein [Companilactobacillus allii]APX72953.1 transposase [Companilactobacillus allii]USQ67745.1 helix-turn-helix domain containing protein [Companilactobacillus allii]